MKRLSANERLILERLDDLGCVERRGVKARFLAHSAGLSWWLAERCCERLADRGLVAYRGEPGQSREYWLSNRGTVYVAGLRAVAA